MKASRRGLTLVEMMFALAIMTLAGGTAIEAMIQTNRTAVRTRLSTGAATAAQNQLDLILADVPFNPQSGQVPASLTKDSTRGGPLVQTGIPIYTDPVSKQMIVSGTMSTSVADAGVSGLIIYRATVTVSYSFNGRTCAVTLSSLRASDT